MKRLVYLLTTTMFAASSLATVKVVTTITDLADLTRQVGGNRVSVESIVRGDQNPHFIDVKPSYMMKLRAADVFFMVGMDLELWAQQLVDGSRNTSLLVVDLSRNINKLDVPTNIDASQGDVHRYGNPHYWLDPRNIRILLNDIVAGLANVSPEDRKYFQANADAYWARLLGQIKRWEDMAKPCAGAKVITFHRSWSYLASWLGIVVADEVEPKPGIPPSPSHTSALIDLVRKEHIKAIIVEPFYDTSAPERIAVDSDARVIRLSTSVGGVAAATDYIALMEYNVATLTAAVH